MKKQILNFQGGGNATIVTVFAEFFYLKIIFREKLSLAGNPITINKKVVDQILTII